MSCKNFPAVRDVIVFTIIALLTSPLLAAIPATQGAYTRHDYMKALLEFNRRTMVEPYKQVGKRDAKWDDDAIKFLDGMAIRFTNAGSDGAIYEIPGAPEPAEVIKLAESARAKGCDDPMVAYCYAAVLNDFGRRTEAAALVKQASADVMNSHYPINRALHAALRAFRFEVDAGGDPASHEVAWQKFRDALVATLATWQWKDIDRRLIYNQLNTVLGDFYIERLRDLIAAMQSVKEADPWMVNQFSGDYEIKEAWQSRGSGWANSVTPEGWKGFYEHLGKARDFYAAALKLQPTYPEPAANMITVAMGAGDRLNEDPRAWFDRAVAAQIDFEPAYRLYLNAILPRWGGSVPMMYNLGLECLATERYDTMVPWKYVMTLENIALDQNTPEFWREPSVYENVRKVCEGYEKTDHTPRMKYFYPSYAAVVAWRSGHYDEARDALEKLGDHADSAQFARMRVMPKLAVSHVYAMAKTGGDAGAIAAAESQATAEKLDDAIASYEALATKHDKDKSAYYIKSRLQQLRWQKQFATGEWVDIQPADAELLGWGELSPKYTRDAADGALLADCKDGNGAALTFEGLFPGHRFEFEATVEPPAGVKEFSAGVTFARNDPFEAHGFFIKISDQPQQQRNLVNTWDPNTRHPFDAAPNYVLHALVVDDKVHMHVNDVLLEHYRQMDSYLMVPKLYIGIGARSDPPGTPVKFRKIRIKKLEQMPE